MSHNITYTQAVTESKCLICGQPAKSDHLSAPYCSQHERELEQKMQQAQREHPERFKW